VKSTDDRIRELEQTVAQLRRQMERKEVRQAMPLSPRHGRFFGITRKDYTQGGDDEFIEVDLYHWATIQGKWVKKPVAPDGFIEARDWYLNEGEELLKKTKVRVEWDENTWVVTGMYCSPTDLEEFNPSSPGSQQGGEYEPAMPYSPSPVSDGGSYGDSYSSPGYEE